MGNVSDCIFLREALEEAVDENKVLAMAGECGCSGECTLEDGCVLYKRRYNMPGEEERFFERLKSEFLSHML